MTHRLYSLVLLAAVGLDSALAYVPAVSAVRFPTRAPIVQHSRHAAPRATALPFSAALAEVESGGGVITDTLLDVAVYGILASVAGLTVYSLVVTLQKSNEEYGGWTPRDDEEVKAASTDPSQRLRAGARGAPPPFRRF